MEEYFPTYLSKKGTGQMTTRDERGGKDRRRK
jgi:hypothetical protein